MERDARPSLILANRLIGTSAIAFALAVSFVGWRVGRRYGSAIKDDSLGRPRPLQHIALALLGPGLVILGFIGVAIAVTLLIT
jgi:hypothetical protein